MMLDRPTVFVIGAGAGHDIGMPLGQGLADRIADLVNFVPSRNVEPSVYQQQAINALHRMAALRKVDFQQYLGAGRMISWGIRYTDSIDNYVRTHGDKQAVKDVAKMAIVQTILRAEFDCALRVDGSVMPAKFRDEAKARASWLTGFFKVLQSQIVEAQNVRGIFRNVTIINFNYDRCIEHFLYHAMQRLYPTLGERNIVELMNEGLRVFHPYGTVGNLLWKTRDRGVHFGMQGDGVDLAELSFGIRTFNEEVDDKEQLSAMRQAIAEAQRLVFLGFHFHKQNVDLLCQEEEGRRLEGPLSVYATRINRSDADMAIVKTRISSIAAGRNWARGAEIDRAMDCAEFFRDYSMALTG